MKIKTSLVAATCFLLFFSCKKDAAPSDAALTSGAISQSVATQLRWQGRMIFRNEVPPFRPVADRYFIKDGAARIYSDTIITNPNDEYETRIWLVIPASANISADSLNFEAGVRNPAPDIPSYKTDITFYLKGETNTAYINHVKNVLSDPDRYRAGLKLGQTIQHNSLLQHDFTEYSNVILQTFNRGLTAYRDDVYLGGLAYGNEPVLGNLKEFGINFKGSGYIDYIKLYNSATGKLLLSEDFNTDGKSTIIINP